MLTMALWSLVFFCLLVERGWIGDLLGQSLVAVAFGAALGEGVMRFFCSWLFIRYKEMRLAFLPLLAFSFHAYALSSVSHIYWQLMIPIALIGAIAWMIYIAGQACQPISDKVIEVTGDISHNGG